MTIKINKFSLIYLFLILALIFTKINCNFSKNKIKNIKILLLTLFLIPIILVHILPVNYNKILSKSMDIILILNIIYMFYFEYIEMNNKLTTSIVVFSYIILILLILFTNIFNYNKDKIFYVTDYNFIYLYIILLVRTFLLNSECNKLYNNIYIYIILLILPYILCIISNDDNYFNYRIILILVYIIFIYNTSIFENNNYINNLIKYKINKNKNFIDIILTILIIIITITLLNKIIFKFKL